LFFGVAPRSKALDHNNEDKFRPNNTPDWHFLFDGSDSREEEIILGKFRQALVDF
jgi:hypothetical protein